MLRKILHTSVISGALIVAPSIVLAAECPAGFPSKAVNYWVGYSAGGGTDVITRLLASEIERAQGWSIVVQNKPGAGSSVMMGQLASAKPDGYTMGATSSGAVTTFPYKNKKSPYNVDSFDYIGTAQSTVISFGAVIDAPFNNFEEMIAYGKKKGSLTLATASAISNLYTDPITAKTGVKFVIVPTKGTAKVMQAVLGGHVDISQQGSGHIQHLQSGKMKQIVTLGDYHPSYAPDVKNTVELGYDIKGADLYVLFAVPKGVDPAIKTCIEQVIDEAVQSDAFAKLQKNLNQVPLNLGAGPTTVKMKADAAVFKKYYADK